MINPILDNVMVNETEVEWKPIGTIAEPYKIGMKVYCLPHPKNNKLFPRGISPSSSMYYTETEIKRRAEGIYTIVDIWFPDSIRNPMIAFLLCQDTRGAAPFHILEAKILYGF